MAKTKAAAVRSDAQTDPDVVAFLKASDHPLKKDIEAVRAMILAVSPDIREGIKWKVPSFRVSDYFATFNVRATDRVQLIFHTGAKVKESATKGVKIADPAGLVEWLAKDRCMVTLGTGKEIQNRRAAFQALVREWIQQL